MSGSKQIRSLVLLLFGLAATGATAWAQDQQQEPPSEPSKPKPAARGVPGIDDTTEDNNNQADQWQPDNTPLTGVATPTLGTPEMRHSYWVPGLAYGTTVQSQPQSGANGQGWYVNNYVGANVSLLQSWSRNQLAVNYTGGGFFSTASFEGNGSFQLLSLADTVTLDRWRIQFFDYFSYLPVTDFGFFGGSGVGLPGVPGSLGAPVPGLNIGIVPNQGVFSSHGPRYSNAFASQVTYQLSRRGSITAAGSYGLLRFTQAGNVDNDMVTGSLGYNYALSKEDSIGIFYQFEAFHYAGQPQAIGTNSISGAYSKKLTQKLALSLYGGPQFSNYRVPIGTQSKTTNASAGASLSYATEQAGITASYFHGLSGGAGVFLGSLTDTANVGLTHKFAHVWKANLNFGYSRNSALGSEPGFSFPSFNDWFVGGGVSRPFGRNINFVANYTAYIESTSGACTTATPCGNTNYTQHTINLSIQWHTRPFILP
jgi:hypothetical protein